MSDKKDSECPWWKKTVVYHLYTRSFYDSNGDGIGDINGILVKLDYLKNLGVETIWFSPFFKSPQRDFGYDVTDYCNIDPQYGDIKLCEKLIGEVHKRDMKVVFDLVLNHTSDQHPWFIESRSGRDNPKRDWYIWKDGKSGGRPPNNWKSMIGGSGWHYDKKTGQWYWAQFLPFQPDLNFRNLEVKKAMFEIVRFWLQKKVDGFRLDIIDAIYEDPSFKNNPFRINLFPSDVGINRFFQKLKYTLDHPDTIDFVKELRKVIDEFDNPSRFLVGEVITDLETCRKYCGEQKPDGLNTVFIFNTLRTPHSAKYFKNLIKNFERYFPEPFIPTWFFSNHDRMRRITRLGNNIEKAKLHVAFQLTVRGIPYIYYGEEIGMESPRLLKKKSKDEMALKYKWVPQVFFDFVRVVGIESFNRDEQRTPMQWDAKPNTGFCFEGVKPWLPIPESYKKLNVENEEDDPDSILNCYKRFLKIRTQIHALNQGSLELLNLDNVSKNLLAYIRRAKTKDKTQEVYVFLNFGNKKISFKNPINNAKLLASTSVKTNPLANDKIILTSQEGIVVLKK
jgi:oligo-1,6-glucosidase/alpha-glucosidase